ncbi:hypothetical protein ACMD2_17728 [Ananas comosus]|uniref:Uncharacterized protein n=1 Tax=Ananas comosus TaxID=4615 RepID=A0A199W0K1_ANACO|nr:hypothetical protein ACMD2_17728 [Ananas comosus]
MANTNFAEAVEHFCITAGVYMQENGNHADTQHSIRTAPLSETTTTSSPAIGRPLSPSISTGVEGHAESVITSPIISLIALIFPHSAPTTTYCPHNKVPDLTIAVANGPLPLSSLASTT